MNLPLSKLLSPAMLALLICSCTYTKTSPAKLNKKGDSVLTVIKNSGGYEDIDLQEKASSGSGGNTTILTARLYNGKNIPAETDTTALKKLGKDIAAQLHIATADAATINGYVVLFCTRTTDGSLTKTHYTGYEYTSDELNK